MGVPKFYRWLSERYACLSQVIKDHQIPEFDNLYLDMNGIIHPCSHPNDDDPHFRISEEDIFLNIFHYIEVLFRIIKPQKVFFMAVDGVAPRAKMNQQRSRRFRSAREAEDNIRKALQKGEVLPTEERFDSNCITPGTEFMVRLQEQLKYFVNKKITTDPGWQEIKIYLSGHETPGEGEHKIMDFIRYERSQAGYNPNTRHCLYGLDADLIMLGLTSHDPHFSLLREEVRFGKNAKRVNNPEDITFHLLHLSLLREYIDWEFESIKTKISFAYDLEKIIDDWILMGFLVGNDFIPNLPNFHINHDALPYLWEIYKDVMPTVDGYLHDGGLLCLPHFECYLKAISKFDLEKYEVAYVDLKWLEGKLGASNEEELSDIFEEDEVDSSCKELKKIAIGSAKKSSKLRDYLKEKNVLEEAEEADDGDFTNEHEKYKLQYYVEKFELTENESSREFIETLSLKYVEAIQWILHYYFNGVPSWGWFFSYHYAPYVSDIKDFKDKTFTFEIGKAFLPFEQLLAVLPAASRKLLPEPFRNLMIMEQSSIIDYYPLEFRTDLNGKRQDWEAVVLIPFIDEERLLAVMEPLYSLLNKSEKNRNRHSPCVLYTYDAKNSEYYKSPSPATSPDLECCRASSEVIPIDKYRLSPERITKGLLSDVKLDIYFPGFPTLKHVAHTGERKKVGVKVFQMHSRGESMVLTIDESEEPDIKEVAESLLGKPCYVGWPHLVEAFVTSVSNGKRKLVFNKEKQAPENVEEVTLSASDVSVWKKQSSCEKQSYMEKKAIVVGMIHVLVEACQIQGKKYVCATKGAVHLQKIWSEWAVTFPLQVTVKNISTCDETDAGAVCSRITDLFPVGTECFMMAVPHYGSSGKVIEVDVNQNRVRVQLTVVPEPDLLSLILNQGDYADVYMPAHVMSQRLGVSTHVLAQITGKVFVANGNKEGSSKVDIGLNLKFSKQNKEVLGYARRLDDKWNYSLKTKEVISMYQKKFPEVFDTLSKSSSQERYTVSDVFPDAEPSSILSDVKNWLKTLQSHNQTAVECGSSTLDEPVLKQIEEAVEKLKGEKQNKKNVKVRVKPIVLYRPMKQMGQVAPDPAADFELFDRVVNVRTLGVAPYGLKGTVVGTHPGKTEKDEKSYEVLFDEPFMGGQSMRGSFENKLFVVQAWSLLNLSYGARVEAKKKGLPSPRPQQPRSGQLLSGAPVDYRPSGRASSRNMYHDLGAWQTPLNMTSPKTSPARPRPEYRGSTPARPSPEYRFPSPRFNSPFGLRPQINSPLRQTPGFRPRLLFNPQTSPHGTSRSPNSHQPPVTRKLSDTADTSAALSAKESERVIREILQMDNPLNANRTPTSPKTIFDGPYYNSPISPTSTSSPLSPSAMLVLACRHNNWPHPSFCHNPTPQGITTTVCAAGKLFQGRPFPNRVESTESAACVALVSYGLLPQSFPFPSPLMNNASLHSFPSPGSSPFTPPSHPSGSPVIRHQGHAQSEQPKRHHNVEKKAHRENSPQVTTPVSADNDKSSGSPRDIPSSTKVKIETMSNRSGGQRKELFIPHQVSLKNKDVPSAAKSKVEETVTEKIAKPEQNQASPKPSENEATPKGAKRGEPRKATPKLLAPSFFSAPPPKE